MSDDKVSKIHFGDDDMPKEKVLEALGEALSPESHKDGDKYEITYAEMREIRKDVQPGILINWGCKKVGFGQLVLSTRDGVVDIDDECMGKDFVKAVFSYIVDEAYKNS